MTSTDANSSPPKEVSRQGWANNTLFLLAAVTLAISLVLFFYRNRWLPALRHTTNRVLRREDYSFLADQEAGLSSNSFNLSSNIASGDSRRGLDNQAKREIQRLMKREGLTFDQARERYTKSQFQHNQIGPDGRPMDPKAVFFS